MTDDLGQRTVPASALRELVAEWRDRADDAPDGTLGNVGCLPLHECADELEELTE